MKDYKSFLPRFEKLKEAEDGWYLQGDMILVEKLPAQEKRTASGLITSVGDQGNREGFFTKQSNFVRVLYVGAGTIDPETDKHYPVKADPGDIIMVDQANVRFFSNFGDMMDAEGNEQIGVTSEGAIRMRFKGEDAYRRAFEILNREDSKE